MPFRFEILTGGLPENLSLYVFNEETKLLKKTQIEIILEMKNSINQANLSEKPCLQSGSCGKQYQGLQKKEKSKITR